MPYFFAKNICPVNMNVYARFDEILSMTLSYVGNTVYAYTQAVKDYKGK